MKNGGDKFMKVKVIIEEVISQTFEVEVSSIENAYEEIRDMYRDGKLVVEDPTLTEANVMITDDNGKEGDWINLHV